MTVHIYQPRRAENISRERSRAALRPRFHDLFTAAHVWRGLVTMDTMEKSPFLPLPFIPPEAGGFLNSRGKTAALAKRKEKRRRRANANAWTQVPAGTSGTHRPERQHRL